MSPIHQVSQPNTTSGALTTPSAANPPNERVALVRHKIGDPRKNFARSRPVSSVVGLPTRRRRTQPPMAACNMDALAMMSATAKASASILLCMMLPIHMLSRNEPRNVQGKVMAPPMNIPAIAIPAGGKIAVA